MYKARIKSVFIFFLTLVMTFTLYPIKNISAGTTDANTPVVSTQTTSTDTPQVKPVAKYKLKKIRGKWYCVSTKTGKKVKGFRTINGKKYYFNKKTGRMVKGWKKIGKNKYYFNKKSGVMATSWKKIGKKWYYFRTNGKMVKNRSLTINGVKYRFRSNGSCTKKPVKAIIPVNVPTNEAPNVDPGISTNGHWETKVISEAWDEVVIDTPAWDEEVKVAIGTKWTQNDTGTDMTGWNSSQKIAWCESHNCPNHCDEYDESQPGYCANNCTGKTTYKIQTIHHDTVTHIVHHDAITEKIWVND